MKPTVHPFPYYLPRRDKSRPVPLHGTRDDAASRELVAALLQKGWELGEPVLNHPPARNPERLLPWELPEVDLSYLEPGAALLQVTRPPLHDREHGDKRTVEAGNTRLERRVLRLWRRYLQVCARSHVRLARPLRDALEGPWTARRDMAFRQTAGSWYLELNALDGRGWRRCPSDQLRTAGFLLRVPSIGEGVGEGGPGLVAAFGMDGVSTLVLAYRLRRDLSHLLDHEGFTLLEIEGRPIPERPTNLLWAREWKLDPVLRHAPL